MTPTPVPGIILLMNDTHTTITIHISHDTHIIDDILNDHPDLQIDLKSNPFKTPVTGPKQSIIPFLLDYYYDDDDQVTLNHPQITQSDIDSYYRSKRH